MVRRALFIFAITSAPAVLFAFRAPLCLVALPASAVAAFWIASPVTYPAWLRRGLCRALLFDLALAPVLWLLTR